MRASSMRLGVVSMLLAGLFVAAVKAQENAGSALRGVAIIPHSIASEMKYRREREPGLSARFQLFINGPAESFKFDGREPAELLAANQWAWHGLGNAAPIPAGAIGMREFNGATQIGRAHV